LHSLYSCAISSQRFWLLNELSVNALYYFGAPFTCENDQRLTIAFHFHQSIQSSFGPVNQ
jgi:hypothetical protein